MAGTATVRVSGSIISFPGGTRAILTSDQVNANSPDFSTTAILANGDNTVTVPVTAKGAIVIFDPNSVSIKKIKGVGGDTGVILRRNGFNYISFDDTPPASFIINSSALDTFYTEIIFI